MLLDLDLTLVNIEVSNGTWMHIIIKYINSINLIGVEE